MDLKTHLKKLISLQGILPLDLFMKICIEHYYKNNNPFGSKGDFTTAPEISQMFGEIIGIWCVNTWLEKEKPSFTLVEIGGGNGTLMSDLLRATKNVPGFHNSIDEIIMVEISERLKNIQKNTINSNKIRWVNHLKEVDKKNCIIICNEFFDALPIKQYKKINGALKEIGIGIMDDNLSFVEIVNDHNFKIENIPEGGVLEVSPQSSEYAKLIDDKSSASLIIDYGYFEPSFKSTLQALKAHKHVPALSNIGDADLTAHVDFYSLSNNFSEKKELSLYTQENFLKKYGIVERATVLKNKSPSPASIDQDLKKLISQDQMGTLFKILEAK